MEIGFSARFDEALVFAACSHHGQARKGTGEPGVPYIVHPVHVATILLRHGFGEDVVIAGLLHDTVEDCDVTIEVVHARFGAAVAELVAAVTEVKLAPGGELRPWRLRKQEQLAHLGHPAHGGEHARDAAALKAADALHNCSSTLADVRREGALVWTRFNASPSDSLWYYRELARLCGERLGADHPLVLELVVTIDDLAMTVTP